MSEGPVLSPRLAAIAAMIPAGKVIADIGTDHALVPAVLILSGRCAFAIASDLRPGPLVAARRTIALHDIDERVSLRQGDGLETLIEGEVDVILIAGMGAERIRAILSAGAELLPSVERLVLQPNGDAEVVRRWLGRHGWGLVDERLVEDRGRFYTVLAAEAAVAEVHYTAADWRLGPILRQRRGPLFERYVAGELRRCERILHDLRRAPIPARYRLMSLTRTRDLLLSELLADDLGARTCGVGVGSAEG